MGVLSQHRSHGEPPNVYLAPLRPKGWGGAFASAARRQSHNYAIQNPIARGANVFDRVAPLLYYEGMTTPNEPLDPDQTVFVLPQEKWDEFVALLDEDPKPMPKLRALLAKATRIVRD